ncbi:MAG: prepilin-type N-terminal cleavage/methylation domain-containing protein [Helicobacteraceae bacterium]|nr:prepilin-type N-terminal cleavage/methylation domain-containing protein [Candidatus Sulfurimonas ponti]
MTKNVNSKEAFTLIEVMVAVVIVSVVIVAMIQMYANNTHIFISLQKQSKTNQYSSFFIGNEEYGFEDKTISLDDLVRDYDLHNDLRRKLKEIKAELLYTEVETIDLSESSPGEDEDLNDGSASSMVLEVGRSVLKTENASSSLLRFKIR